MVFVKDMIICPSAVVPRSTSRSGSETATLVPPYARKDVSIGFRAHSWRHSSISSGDIRFDGEFSEVIGDELRSNFKGVENS